MTTESNSTADPSDFSEQSSSAGDSEHDGDDAKSDASSETVKAEPQAGPSKEGDQTPTAQVQNHVKQPRDPSRYPDFVCRLLFQDVHRRILFIVEVKRFPPDYAYALGPKPQLAATSELIQAFVRARKQIVEQVQLAFARYPEEDELRALCIVGLLFQVLTYKRGSTPLFDEYSDKPDSQYHTYIYGPDHIFNQRFTGYSTAFVKEWRSAASVKTKEIKGLVKKGKKGTMAANPIMDNDPTTADKQV